MKKRGPLIFVVSFAIGFWFLVPFALAFFEDMPFSFGPTGLKLESEGDFLLYGGIINRDGKTVSQALVIVWMLTLPLCLFVYHIALLYQNHNHIKKLIQLDEISPRQFFIIKSGRLSFVIFFVQIFNVGKLVFSFVLEKIVSQSQNEDDAPTAQITLFVLNVIYDLMPLILIYIYFKYYYREGKNLQERSEVMTSSLVSSFNSGNRI